MEGQQFDDLVRGTAGNTSRRGVLRLGLGALGASALAVLGVSVDDAEAKKKKKKKKKKVRCQGARPLTCGDGCCPTAFPVCCDDASHATDSFGCNPASSVCCPAEQGGGSCNGEFTKCCPTTTQFPFGHCAPTNGVCCTSAQGGGSCSVTRPTCCPGEPNDPFSFSDCCLANQTCCLVDSDCPGTRFCSGRCCVESINGPTRAGKTGKVGVERFHMKAR